MSNRPPPVPSAGRSKKDPAPEHRHAEADSQHGHATVENKNEQGQQGNIHQNTTNQGYQQDR
ncbi:MAG TPA: hypothetical protein VG328_19395 [Stellaceae bacterium]|jgi:hypothetical protein|nr:hypothetical protein [Stellaceae bacterium]